MAPSPEHDKEPKAPDKNDNKTATETTEIRNAQQPQQTEQHLQNDLPESSVSTLDDVQLKSLLDEAINYKTPKDREGKSQIFKDLLQEAEEDERNARAASASGPQLARYYNTGAIGSARRHRNRKETSASSTLTHGGSLQDLAQSDLYSEHPSSGASSTGSSRRSAGGRRHRNQKTVSVSARQREGGSLPSNVNAGARNLLFDDYIQHNKKTKEFQQELDNIKPEYTVVDLTNIENNNNCAENTTEKQTEETSLLIKETRNYSTLDSDANSPKYRYPLGDLDGPEDSPPQQQQQQQQLEKQKITRHQYFNPLEEYNKLPRIKYTSMAKVDIDESNNQVDKAISFSQFSTTDVVEPEYNNLETSGEMPPSVATSTTGAAIATTTTVVSSVAGRTHALAKLSSDYRLLALPTSTKTMERFKGLDENGNSLHHQPPAIASTTPQVTSQDINAKKKSKKSKVDRNVSVLDAKDIAGHQADIIQDIDQLVKYIEENDTHTQHKKHIIDVMKKPKRIKTKSETSTPKTNLKKSNSLEEISKTTFADLMNSDGGAKRSRVKKQSTSEDGDRNNIINDCKDRRSWGTEDSQQYMMSKHQREAAFTSTPDPQVIQLINQQETAEFHVVTKKKKSKKRNNLGNNHGGNKEHYNRSENKQTNSHGRSYHRINAFSGENSVPTRRKSACSVPPSDKSGESSDVDSVHSLPATTNNNNKNTKNNKNQTDDQQTTNEFNDTIAALVSSPGCNTSYADIAKNNNLFNPLVQQPQPQPQHQFIQHQQNHQKSSTTIVALKSVEHFPELLCTLDNSIMSTTTQQTQTISESSPVNNNKQCKSDVVRPQKINNNIRRNTTKRQQQQPQQQQQQPPQQQQQQQQQHHRPAVIILNDCSNNKDDINFVQQSPSEPIQVSGLTFGFELNEQLLNDEPADQPQQQTNFCARFLAPANDVKDNYNHDKIVQFIGMAWEELIHDNKSKIQYYNGQ